MITDTLYIVYKKSLKHSKKLSIEILNQLLVDIKILTKIHESSIRVKWIAQWILAWTPPVLSALYVFKSMYHTNDWIYKDGATSIL